MDIDVIAAGHTDDLDRVYPPMLWYAIWSDGSNIPLGLAMPDWARQILHVPDYYRPGLWLFSDEGHGHHLPDIGRVGFGISVTAYNRREAEARLRLYLAEHKVTQPTSSFVSPQAPALPSE